MVRVLKGTCSKRKELSEAIVGKSLSLHLRVEMRLAEKVYTLPLKYTLDGKTSEVILFMHFIIFICVIKRLHTTHRLQQTGVAYGNNSIE